MSKYGRIGHLISAWLLVLGVGLQVFLAGSAILVKFGDWIPHREMGRLLLWPILALLLFSFVGRMSRRTVWLGVLLLVLYVFQFVLIYVPQQLGLTVLRAMHPVNALAIFWVAIYVGLQSWRQVRGN